MKNLCLLLLLLLLTGCGSAAGLEISDLKNDPLPEEVLQPEETVSYAVSMVTWEDCVQAEDGTVLASYRFQVPSLTARRENGTAITEAETETEEQALSVSEAFNHKFKEWAAAGEFQEVSDDAREWWEFQQSSGESGLWIGEYTLELASAVYQTERMISVSGDYYSFTGGAHGNTTLMAWNYDLTTGSFFSPELLAEDGKEFMEAVKAELIRQANTPQEADDRQDYVPAMDYWENYEDIMANWSSYAVFFDENGMTVGFSPYELASYANGPQIFHVSYSWLRPYLSQQGLELLGLE